MKMAPAGSPAIGLLSYQDTEDTEEEMERETAETGSKPPVGDPALGGFAEDAEETRREAERA